MTSLYEPMDFRQLQWLFPAAVTLHNGEEAIWMPVWSARHAVALPVHPPPAPEIRLILFVLTVAAFVVTYLSSRRGPQSFWAYLLFGYIVTMLVNVFVPHVPAALIFRSYAPGVATAVLINLPVMAYLAVLALRERWISGWKAVAFGAGVPLLLASAVLVLLFESKQSFS